MPSQRITGFAVRAGAGDIRGGVSTGSNGGFPARLNCGAGLLIKLGGLRNPNPFECGWHTTPTSGPSMVADATATVLGLSATGVLTALGIAAYARAGLRGIFGTMTKPFHAEQASRAGLLEKAAAWSI